MNQVMSAQADNDDARLQLAKSEASQETAEQALADAKIELDRVSKDATAAENEVSRLQAEVKATKAEAAAEEAAMERDEGNLAQQLARMEAEAKEREDYINADIAAAHATLEAARAEAIELDSRLSGHTAVAEEAQRLRAALIEGKAWHLHKSLVKTIKDSKSEQVRLQNILVHSQEQRSEAMTTLEGARSQRDKLKAQLSAALAAASSAENAVTTARRDMAYQAIESGSSRPALTDMASPPGGARTRSPASPADQDAHGMNSEMAELRAMLADLKATMAQEMSTLDAQAAAAQQMASRASSRERQ
jgi:chromosome segregation ATPase